MFSTPHLKSSFPLPIYRFKPSLSLGPVSQALLLVGPVLGFSPSRVAKTSFSQKAPLRSSSPLTGSLFFPTLITCCTPKCYGSSVPSSPPVSPRLTTPSLFSKFPWRGLLVLDLLLMGILASSLCQVKYLLALFFMPSFPSESYKVQK